MKIKDDQFSNGGISECSRLTAAITALKLIVRADGRV